jgi:hypothetical protein
VDGGIGDEYMVPWTPIYPILLENDLHSHQVRHMQGIVASDICENGHRPKKLVFLKPEIQFVTSFNDSTVTLRDFYIPRRMSALI